MIALLLVRFVVSMRACSRRRRGTAAQAHEKMTTTALQVAVPGDVEAGEDGSGAAASERLSRGGPDPQHH